MGWPLVGASIMQIAPPPLHTKIVISSCVMLYNIVTAWVLVEYFDIESEGVWLLTGTAIGYTSSWLKLRPISIAILNMRKTHLSPANQSRITCFLFALWGRMLSICNPSCDVYSMCLFYDSILTRDYSTSSNCIAQDTFELKRWQLTAISHTSWRLSFLFQFCEDCVTEMC